jgi:redox-sensitive bicupin YhaK (pirin superfamily)
LTFVNKVFYHLSSRGALSMTELCAVNESLLKRIKMKKNVRFTTQGQRADIGEYRINRILPNRYAEAVGPFVFLDHVLPAKHPPDEPTKVANGSGAHPHRGIATLTYLLNGEAEHRDSRGHYAKVHSGGAQWMKAGNGIIHDEVVNADPQSGDYLTHGFQFWINLPAKQKAEPPEYLPLQASDVPSQELGDKRGWIRVIAGAYENLVSPIPAYSRQLLYHIHLESGKQFSLSTEKEWEFAALLPTNPAVINDTEYRTGDFLAFDKAEGSIDITNHSEKALDVIVFGGEKYAEPIVFGGPFVMNSELEIAAAYRDFHAGRYGKINYGRDN